MKGMQQLWNGGKGGHSHEVRQNLPMPRMQSAATCARMSAPRDMCGEALLPHHFTQSFQHPLQ